MSVCWRSGTLSVSFFASGRSNRHNSTLVACAEKIAKLTPTPVQLAPSGYGSPGHTRIAVGGASRYVPVQEARLSNDNLLPSTRTSAYFVVATFLCHEDTKPRRKPRSVFRVASSA